MKTIFDEKSELTIVVGEYDKGEFDEAIAEYGPCYVYGLFAAESKIGEGGPRKSRANRIDENRRRMGCLDLRMMALFHEDFSHDRIRRLYENRVYYALRNFVSFSNKRERAGVVVGKYDREFWTHVQDNQSRIDLWVDAAVSRAVQFELVPKGTFRRYRKLVEGPWFELLLTRGCNSWCRIQYEEGRFRIPVGSPVISKSGRPIRLRQEVYVDSPREATMLICRSEDGRKRIIKSGHGGSVGDSDLEIVGGEKPMDGLWRFKDILAA